MAEYARSTFTKLPIFVSCNSPFRAGFLNRINVVGRVGVAVAVIAVDIIELDIVIHVAADEVHSFVDLDRLGELAVGLQVSGLRTGVCEDFKVTVVRYF